MGHRSTSVGDHMRVDGQLYIVANMGFKPVEEIKLRQMFI
jgi:16S rRNA G1207 methylase RsmC